MRRRSLYFLLAGALLICFVVLVVAQREPGYQGRTLTSWLFQAQASNLGGLEGFLDEHARPDLDQASPRQAINAIRQIGPRAVPELLDWIRRPTSLKDEHLRALQQLLPSPSVRERIIQNRADLAVFGFRVLGSRASSAVPELTRLMKERTVSQQTREAAMAALANLGTIGLNPLLNAFADPSQPTRRLAGFYISGMRYLGTNAAPAVPVLIGLLKDEDEQIAGRSAAALGDLEIEPVLAIPALTNALQDPRAFVRASAASAIVRFGSRAQSAIPALTAALSDPKLQVRSAVTNALFQLSPKQD